MDMLEAMIARRSVRTYTDRPIEGEVLESLNAEIDACNAEGGLHIQLVLDEPEAFGTGIFKYGQFKGVRNYLCFVGPDDDALDEKVGYYGERVILHAQQLGLSSCWVALTFSSSWGSARAGWRSRSTSGARVTNSHPAKSWPSSPPSDMAPHRANHASRSRLQT